MPVKVNNMPNIDHEMVTSIESKNLTFIRLGMTLAYQAKSTSLMPWGNRLQKLFYNPCSRRREVLSLCIFRIL
jgi:hypothetical protein